MFSCSSDKHKEVFTIVGAGGCVFGAGLADDIFMDLAPLVFIVAPKTKEH